MQSKIRIEFDFDTNQPVLRITQAKESDDLRDTMLKSFIQKATNENSHLYFTFPDFHDRRDNSVVELRCEVVKQEETQHIPDIDRIVGILNQRYPHYGDTSVLVRNLLTQIEGGTDPSAGTILK